jgi:hypothetical protein
MIVQIRSIGGKEPICVSDPKYGKRVFVNPEGIVGYIERPTIYKSDITSMVEACKKWLLYNAIQRKNKHSHASSYLLKHVVEAETGQYIYNGAFIKAALEIGYTAYWNDVHDGPNCDFNMDFGVVYEGRILK